MGEQVTLDELIARAARPPANARTEDPDTSHEAGAIHEGTGAAGRQRVAVLRVVQARPGLTAREIGVELGGDELRAAGRRLPELERAGLVIRGDVRLCAEGRKRSATWWPAGRRC